MHIFIIIYSRCIYSRIVSLFCLIFSNLKMLFFGLSFIYVLQLSGRNGFLRYLDFCFFGEIHRFQNLWHHHNHCYIIEVTLMLISSIVHNNYASFDQSPALEMRANFLDISKAFERVWPEGLLFKLEHIEMSANLLNLLKSFFNCCLAVPWSNSGHSRGDILTNPMLITTFSTILTWRQSVSARNECMHCNSHVLCHGQMRLCVIHNSFASYDGTSFMLVVLTRLIISELKCWVTWSRRTGINFPFLRGKRIQYFSVSAQRLPLLQNYF